VRVILTTVGQELLKSIDHPIRDLHRARFASLATEEVEALTAPLNKPRSVVN
jgi:hypothetical protein